MAMIVVGLIFLFGVYPLTVLWPSGWVWHDGGQSNDLQMIVGVYAAIMAVRAIQGGAHDRGHLFGDVPALLIVAAFCHRDAAPGRAIIGGGALTEADRFKTIAIHRSGPSCAGV
jgi:hypothetical protein